MINMLVRGQRLVLGQAIPFVVSDTINYIEAQFSFVSPDWAGLVKWAHFAQGDKVYDVMLDGDRITQDAGLDLSAGVWQVYLHGNRIEDGEVTQRVTTNSVEITVRRAGVLDGEPLPSVPPSAGEQILARAEEARRIAQSVREDADSGAFDGEPGKDGKDGAQGPQGPPGPAYDDSKIVDELSSIDGYVRSKHAYGENLTISVTANAGRSLNELTFSVRILKTDMHADPNMIVLDCIAYLKIDIEANEADRQNISSKIIFQPANAPWPKASDPGTYGMDKGTGKYFWIYSSRRNVIAGYESANPPGYGVGMVQIRTKQEEYITTGPVTVTYTVQKIYANGF